MSRSPPAKTLATMLGEMIRSPSRQKPFHAPTPAARSVNTRCTTTSPSVNLSPNTYRNPNAKPIMVFSTEGKRTCGSRGSSNLCRMMLQHGLLLTSVGKIAEFNPEQRHRVHNTNSSHISNTTRRDPTFHIRSLRAASNRAGSSPIRLAFRDSTAPMDQHRKHIPDSPAESATIAHPDLDVHE